jgi:hypothetical protein
VRVRFGWFMRRWGWRALAVGTFGAAGVGKLLSEHETYASLFLTEGQPVWLQRVAHGIESAVPGVEILIAGAFLCAYGIHVASWIGVALSLAFLGIALAVPPGYECKCLGIIGGFSTRPAHLAAAVVALVVSWMAGRSGATGASSMFARAQLTARMSR